MADGGRIILTAKSANDVLGTVVNNSGVLQAQSLGVRDGQVWLLASDDVANTGANGAAANAGAVHDAAGAVVSSGTIDVSGDGAAAAGQATLAGTTVTRFRHDRCGQRERRRGTGARSIRRKTTTLAAGSRIDVSSSAAAGKVVAWSDGRPRRWERSMAAALVRPVSGATVEVSSAHDIGFDAHVAVGRCHVRQGGHADPGSRDVDDRPGIRFGGGHRLSNSAASAVGECGAFGHRSDHGRCADQQCARTWRTRRA